jgi:hypothetical protein
LYFDRPDPGAWKLVVDPIAPDVAGTKYRLADYVVEGLALPIPGRTPIPVVGLGLLADDPFVYYNEGPDAGPIDPRKGLNPIIFDYKGFAF